VSPSCVPRNGPDEPRLGRLITFASIAFASTALLLVRRRAPDGSFFAEGDPAAGFFGGLEPAAMERALTLLGEASEVVGVRGRLPCDEQGTPVTAAEAAATGSKWSPPFSWLSRPSPPPGAATRPPAGTASRRRRRPPSTRRASTRRAHPISRTPRPRSTSRPHTLDRRLRDARAGARGLLPPAVPAGVRARGPRPDRDASAPKQRRAVDTVRDAAVQLAAAEDAERLDRRAEVLAADVRRNIQRSTNYVLGAVLFAVALFFAGMSTKVPSRGAQRALVACGCAVFVGAAAWIATFPISVSV
jgi:hypothetical protein